MSAPLAAAFAAICGITPIPFCVVPCAILADGIIFWFGVTYQPTGSFWLDQRLRIGFHCHFSFTFHVFLLKRDLSCRFSQSKT